MTTRQLMFQPLRRYADFQGRSARQEYWLWTLFMVLVWAAFGILINTIGAPVRVFGYNSMIGWSWRSVIQGYGPLGRPLIALRGLFALITFVPSLAVSVRRLHDTGKSGWWVLIALVPFLGWIVLLVFMVIDGAPGNNVYGPSPRGQDAVDTLV